MYHKKTTGYVFPRINSTPPGPSANCEQTVATGYGEDCKPPKGAPVCKAVQAVDTVSAGALAAVEAMNPVLQQGLLETARILQTNNPGFFNQLLLKSLDNAGYHSFVYICEESENTCVPCLEAHGHIFSWQEIENGQASLPRHPHCRCSLVGIDSADKMAYDQDTETFLLELMEKLGTHSGGIYRLANGAVYPVPASGQTGGESGPGQSDTPWYEQLKAWADEFGADAQAAWNALLAAADERARNMFKDVPSFLDWLTLGVVSGFLDANTVRYNEMVQAPSVYSVANWLLLGIPETVKGAIMPEKPLSLEHWIDSLNTVLLVASAIELAGAAGAGSTGGAGSAAKPAAPVKPTTGGPVPDIARDIADQIKNNNGTPLQGYKGGKIYQNNPVNSGQKLPNGISYREYDIHPYIKGQGRGTERIVIGNDGSVWYTKDHYQTFTKVE